MLYNALRGTVQIEITGGWPERFLSSCAHAGIGLWDSKHISEDCFTAWVSAADYFRLRTHAKRTMTRLRILKKKGIPFAAYKLMRRKALWIAGVVCMLGVWYLSGFVWSISVTGCQYVSQREVMELLAEHGLRFGTRVRSIDGDLLRNDVLLDTDKLSYLVVNVHGTHAEIKITERAPTLDLEALAEPCDVVADGTGIIQELRVLQGKALVKVGDVVTEGTRMASGIIQDAQGGVTKVHAMAEADILTRRVIRTAVPGNAFLHTRTGTRQKRRYLVLGNCKIPLNFIEKDTYTCYDKILETKSLVLRKDFQFDLKLVTEVQYENSTAPAEIDVVALSEALRQRMEASYAASYPTAQVQRSSFRMEEENGAYVGILELETIETVGIMAPLEEEVLSGTDR